VTQAPSYFIEKDGLVYAGTSLLIDLWDAHGLDDLELMRRTLLDGVERCGATLRAIDLHQFAPPGGIAGAAMLVQSHISVHTWPENGYGAFDAFMCGAADPYRLIPVLRDAFTPERVQVFECRRGVRL